MRAGVERAAGERAKDGSPRKADALGGSDFAEVIDHAAESGAERFRERCAMGHDYRNLTRRRVAGTTRP